MAINRLQSESNQHPNIGNIRGEGLMIGIEFISDQHKTLAPDLVKQVLSNVWINIYWSYHVACIKTLFD